MIKCFLLLANRLNNIIDMISGKTVNRYAANRAEFTEFPLNGSIFEKFINEELALEISLIPITQFTIPTPMIT